MVGAVCTLPMWPCLLLAWQHLVSSGELGDSRVWLGHLPGLEQFMEIWDTRNAEPIVEWRAYFLPSPFPRQINLLSTEWTPYDFHEKVYHCICPTGRAGRVIKIQISHLFAWLVAMMEMYKERFYSVFCGELRITHSADTRMANNKILYNVNLFLSSTIDMVADYKETAAPLVTLFLLSAAVPVCLLIRPTVPLSQSMITQNISSIFHIVYLYMCPAALSLCPSAGRSEYRSEAQTEPQEVTGIQCLVQGRVSRRDSGCLERLTFSMLDVLFSYMLLPVIVSNSEIKNS